jgi:hypothetical protein
LHEQFANARSAARDEIDYAFRQADFFENFHKFISNRWRIGRRFQNGRVSANDGGTDSKAGGREYLLQFMQGKLVSEKIGAVAKSESKEVLNAGDTRAKAF